MYTSERSICLLNDIQPSCQGFHDQQSFSFIFLHCKGTLKFADIRNSQRHWFTGNRFKYVSQPGRQVIKMIGLEQKDPHPPTLIYWSVFKLEKRKKIAKTWILVFQFVFYSRFKQKNRHLRFTLSACFYYGAGSWDRTNGPSRVRRVLSRWAIPA